MTGGILLPGERADIAVPQILAQKETGVSLFIRHPSELAPTRNPLIDGAVTHCGGRTMFLPSIASAERLCFLQLQRPGHIYVPAIHDIVIGRVGDRCGFCPQNIGSYVDIGAQQPAYLPHRAAQGCSAAAPMRLPAGSIVAARVVAVAPGGRAELAAMDALGQTDAAGLGVLMPPGSVGDATVGAADVWDLGVGFGRACAGLAVQDSVLRIMGAAAGDVDVAFGANGWLWVGAGTPEQVELALTAASKGWREVRID